MDTIEKLLTLESDKAALLAALAEIDTTLCANVRSSTSRPGIRQANRVLDICRDARTRFATPTGKAS